MFGYRDMKWNRPHRNTWVSHNEQYVIDKLDAITYCPAKKLFVLENGVKVFDDHIVRSPKAFSKLAQAKKWCDKECEQDYLFALQFEINQTSRYGS